MIFAYDIALGIAPEDRRLTRKKDRGCISAERKLYSTGSMNIGTWMGTHGKIMMAMEVSWLRRRGRPKRKWLDNTRNDLSERELSGDEARYREASHKKHRPHICERMRKSRGAQQITAFHGWQRSDG